MVAAMLVLALAGCTALRPHEEPLPWASLGTGCYPRGLSEPLLMPDDIGTGLGLTDIRIGRLPDTGNGPGLMAHFRRALDGPFGQRTGQPTLLLAVGDWRGSCAVLLERGACPAAERMHASLAALSLPVGHAFSDPQPLQVIHGDTTFLSVRDGHGNQNDWSYVGLDHPVQAAVWAALDELEACAEPAAQAFSRTTR
jgi:hypothetical protein